MEAADATATTSSASSSEDDATCHVCGNDPPAHECAQCGRAFCKRCMLRVGFTNVCGVCVNNDTDNSTTEEDS